MLIAAVAVFFADVFAVAVTVASLWLERRFGFGWGLILDAIMIVAVGYGAGAWLLGKVMQRQLGTWGTRTIARNAGSADHGPMHPAH